MPQPKQPVLEPAETKLAEETGHMRLRIVTPPDVPGPLPVIFYIHGAGWVFGSSSTHDRVMRELAVSARAAVVFPDDGRSPEARYPVAIEECGAAIAEAERFAAALAAGDQGPS